MRPEDCPSIGEPAVWREQTKNFDIFNSGDPYALLGHLRATCPIAWSDRFGGYWIVTRFRDIDRVLRDNEHFSSVRHVIPAFDDPLGRQIPLQYDPPDHAKYRHDLQAMFSWPRVATWEPVIREVMRRHIEPIVQRGGGELVAQLCVPAPLEIFGAILGVPNGDLPVLRSFAVLIIREGLSGDPEKRDYVDHEVRPAVYRFFDRLLDDRARSPDPPSDLLTDLTRARFGDRPFTRDEQLRAVLLLMTAALDTVTNSLSLALWYLATNPGDRSSLSADRSLIPRAVEEFLRYFTPVTMTRLCVQDLELGAVRIRAGDQVLLSTPSGSRDEDQFPNADRIDVRRASNRHLAFGGGPHRCLGAPLATAEMRIALDELLTAIPSFALPAGFVPERHWGLVYGLETLEIVAT